MKKKIALWLAFAVLSGVILFCLQALLMPKNMSGKLLEGALISEYYDNAGRNDVIFIGDCEVYENFSPITMWEEYGITSIIRGSPQQLIWQSYYLMEETLRYEKPKVMVFNVLSMKYDTPDSTKEQDKREEYNRLTLDGMRWSESKWNSMLASMSKEEREDKVFTVASYLFPILRYHDRWNQLTEEDFKYWFSRDTVSDNGYLMKTGKVPLTDHAEPPLVNYDFGENSWYYLEKMTKLCKDNGIQLVLIKAPALSPKWWPQWDEQIETYAAENDLLYINMLEHQEEIGIDWDNDTYDAGLHLNVYGAEKAARWFGKVLQEKFQLADHRVESYLSVIWDEKCETYHNRKKEMEEK